MASISNINNATSMNGIITVTAGYATIENCSITSENIATSNNRATNISIH